MEEKIVIPVEMLVDKVAEEMYSFCCMKQQQYRVSASVIDLALAKTLNQIKDKKAKEYAEHSVGLMEQIDRLNEQEVEDGDNDETRTVCEDGSD